jgi:membrane-associated progesterone receptor component
MYQALLYSLLIILPFVYLFLKRIFEKKFQSALVEAMTTEDSSTQQTGKTGGSIMQPPNDTLAPPLDHPYTVEQLKAYDGSDPSKPILVAIKGQLH